MPSISRGTLSVWGAANRRSSISLRKCGPFPGRLEKTCSEIASQLLELNDFPRSHNNRCKVLKSGLGGGGRTVFQRFFHKVLHTICGKLRAEGGRRRWRHSFSARWQ